MGETYGHMDMGVSSSRSSLADSPSITITSWPMEWNGMVNCFLLSNFMANICRLWPRSRVGDPAEMHLGSGVSRQPQPRLQLKSYNFIFIFICSRLAFASSAGFTFLYNLIRMCFSGNCIIFFTTKCSHLASGWRLVFMLYDPERVHEVVDKWEIWQIHMGRRWMDSHAAATL